MTATDKAKELVKRFHGTVLAQVDGGNHELTWELSKMCATICAEYCFREAIMEYDCLNTVPSATQIVRGDFWVLVKEEIEKL